MVARVHLAQSEPEMARDRQTLGAPSARAREIRHRSKYRTGSDGKAGRRDEHFQNS